VQSSVILLLDCAVLTVDQPFPATFTIDPDSGVIRNIFSLVRTMCSDRDVEICLLLMLL